MWVEVKAHVKADRLRFRGRPCLPIEVADWAPATIIRGRCVMVRPQPSKLMIRVRFPSPAPDFLQVTM